MRQDCRCGSLMIYCIISLMSLAKGIAQRTQILARETVSWSLLFNEVYPRTEARPDAEELSPSVCKVV